MAGPTGLSRTAKRVAALSAAALALSVAPLVGGAASAADGDVVVTPVSMQNCNGIRDTPGSENTQKDIVGGTLERGGTVTFRIDYPVTAEEVGSTFTIEDCFERTDLPNNQSLLGALKITVVPNNTAFSFEYTLQIPDSVPLGTEVCNYAKTTGKVSAAQASNRKAVVCFAVGGTLRVEKHDAVTGEVIGGARFTVDCRPTTDFPDLVISGLEDAAPDGDASTGNPVTGYANSGAIAINGPEGTPCTVTELEAPPGYVLPPADERTHSYVIPASSAAEELRLKVIENTPVPPEYAALTAETEAAGTFDVEAAWTLGKSAEPSEVSGLAGGSAGSTTWTVTADRDDADPSNHQVAGTAVVSNSNDIPADATVGVTIGGDDATVDCDADTAGDQPDVTVPAGGTASCDYSGAASDSSAQVVVTVTSGTDGVGGVTTDPVGVEWSENATGPQSITVSDDQAPADVLPATVSESDEWSYPQSFTCPTSTEADYVDGEHVFEVENTVTADDESVEPVTAIVTVTCALAPVAPQRDLRISKSVVASDSVVNPGDTLTYTLTVVNRGEVTEEDVVVSDYVPGTDPARAASGSTTLVPDSATCDGDPCTVTVDSSGLISWELGDLEPATGDPLAPTRSVTFAVTIQDAPEDGSAVADILNLGTVESTDSGPNDSNLVRTPVNLVEDTTSTTITPTPDPTTSTITPRQLPFVDEEQEQPRVLPFTGAWLLPTLALGLGAALIGALLIGAGRRRELGQE